MTENEKLLARALAIAVVTLNTTWEIINGENYVPFDAKDFLTAAAENIKPKRRKNGDK